MIVISPSYKRARSCLSHKVFGPGLVYAVHEFESKEYQDMGHKVQVIPDKLRGNIARVRNWILSENKGSDIVMVDDDISNFFFIKTTETERQKISMSPADLNEFIEKGFVLAKDCGAKLWGVNVAHDPRFYTQNRPFSFSLPVLGTFSCHVANTPGVYDETLPLKEDYDFFLQRLSQDRLVLRLNFAMYIAEHQTMDGGCTEYRTAEAETDNFKRLQARWGSDIVRSGGDSDINPVLKRPI